MLTGRHPISPGIRELIKEESRGHLGPPGATWGLAHIKSLHFLPLPPWPSCESQPAEMTTLTQGPSGPARRNRLSTCDDATTSALLRDQDLSVRPHQRAGGGSKLRGMKTDLSNLQAKRTETSAGDNVEKSSWNLLDSSSDLDVPLSSNMRSGI